MAGLYLTRRHPIPGGVACAVQKPPRNTVPPETRPEGSPRPSPAPAATPSPVWVPIGGRLGTYQSVITEKPVFWFLCGIGDGHAEGVLCGTTRYTQGTRGAVRHYTLHPGY